MKRGIIRGQGRSAVLLAVGLCLLVAALAACDPGGRLAQLTPQAPAGTPVILGITAEAPGGGTLATPGAQAPPPGLPQPPGLSQPPTAVYDPALPAWTILYYAGAENGRAAYVWDDLNEMEAAAQSDQVQIVAQIDWAEGSPANTAEAVRYRIVGDGDRGASGSEVMATLGEANMGDPATLADFIAWGVATYPANRYGLFLGDFGNGWQGCCLDAATGAGEQSDHLSLPDIDQALSLAQSRSNARLEVIAFSAGLMSQLDVLQAIQPYAAYAVAAAGLTPGASWDFEPVLTQLSGDPLIDGRRFAGDLATSFVNYQRQIAGDEYSGMAAVDLGQIPALAAAVEGLALVLESDSAVYGAIAAEGRRGAQTYGGAAPGGDTIAAIDLLHAAAIMSEIAPPGELQTAAAATSAAVTSAVVAYDHGLGIPYGRGVAIYWPETAEALDPAYAQVSRLPSWAAYLATAAPPPVAAPRVLLEQSPRPAAHIANPALLRAEVIGQRLTEVALIADQEAADGRRVLRQYETIQPATATLPAGTNASLWRDGWHESLIIWDATAAYLADAAGTGDFAVLRPVDFSSIGPQLAAVGQFIPAGSATGWQATAVFNQHSAASQRIWAAAEGAGEARLYGELPPAEGDAFQLASIFHEADGRLANEPGATLTFDAAAAVYRSTRPLPGGNFTVGMRAQAADGAVGVAMEPVAVDPAAALPGFRSFVDAPRNVQFVYPVDWLPPESQEGITYSSNISDTAQLQVRYYPGWTGDLAALHEEVLGTFGEVSILLQEPVEIGAEAAVAGVRTAYGYESGERGSRTGMFLTFLLDGVGYVVDLDGPREQEAATVATIDAMAATWQFLPPRLGFGPEQWAALNVGDFRLRYPLGYAYQEFNNWHRFAADPQTFLAVRVQPAGRTPAEALTGMLQTAAEGVAGFSADEPERLFYGGHLWERNDFHYTDANGNIVAGLLLVRRDENAEVAFWAEAADPAGELINSIFLPAAAAIERIPPPPSG